ncbi:MAG: segregation and condensation protein [Candidatus Sumerlaeota bacterium]|nr:segregation and condensation protein [Candidatus Sumerlaeota bacterium]
MSAEKNEMIDEQAPAAPESAEEGSGTDAESVEVGLPLPLPEEVPAVVEALLFATTQPLSLKRLQMLSGGVGLPELEDALTILRERYDRPGAGLMLMEVAGGYQLATRAEVADWVLALHKHRRKNPISPAVMETLAIVAYKQPIVRAEIEAIRGVDCSGVLRSLQDAGLVEVVGQKEVAGRPSLYGTSTQFLKTFGLRDLKELPSLSDLQSVMHAQMKRSEAEDAAEEGAPEAPASEPTAENTELSPNEPESNEAG